MKNLPQILFFAVASLFGLAYGGYWAYGSLYKAPRIELTKEITQFEQNNELLEANIATMSSFVEDNQHTYLSRSFPQSATAVRTFYQHWLSEVATFCDFVELQIVSFDPTQTAWCFHYRFHLRGRVSSEGFARFLYEFYWAPYLHRVTSFSLIPVEQSDLMIVDMTIEGIALYRMPTVVDYPLFDRLPEGWHKRLASGPFSTYQTVADRNLLQFTRAGVDLADFTAITFINIENGEPQLWLTDRTSSSTKPIVVKLNDTVKIGSFVAKFIESDGNYAIFDRDGQYWLLEIGERLSQAFALPPEAR